MKKILPVYLLAIALSGAASAATLWTEGFEDSFPPAGWITNSVEQKSFAYFGEKSVLLNAAADYLITPPITNARTLIFWSYTTAADPDIVVSLAPSPDGPWSEAAESPFNGFTEDWAGRSVDLSAYDAVSVRFQKSGTGNLYIDEVSFENGVAISNQPPVLDPIGSQTVLEMGTLSFTVTADDPVDDDQITLSATHLPTGATFSTNGFFVWSNALPAGIYSVTFYATDKDGSDSETIDITVSDRPKLFISEIADPSGTGADAYRFVEFYNAGTNTIDLAADGWTLSKQVNGGTWYDVPLTGTVAAATARVIAYSAVDFEDAYGFAPDQESSTVSGNGDDAYFLYYNGDHTNGALIDLYGEFNTDGTGTAWDYEDSRAVRNDNILMPNPVWAASEWTITADVEPGGMTPGAHGPRPVFQGLENPFVFLGDSLSLTITAANTILTNDVITLSTNALPAGATFATAVGTNTVSSTLNWNTPTAGVYTASFSAAGMVGTSTTSITITVSSRARIAGYFYGWSGDTIFKLDNGQFWQQSVTKSKTVDPPLYRPSITISNVFGAKRMIVAGVTDYVAVVPLEVTESTVTNAFTGLRDGNFYQLADGTVWEQNQFVTVASSANPVTAWRWIKKGQQMMRFLDRNNVVIGTCVVTASALPADDTVRSEIDGWFRGWQSSRIFALKDGTFWKQTSVDSSSLTLWSPSVTVSNWFQTEWRMNVAGASGTITVQPVDAVRTTVDGNFYGFGRHNIFKLSNGEWWRQTSLDSSASTRQSPDVILWSENGTDYIEMPDEGRCVAAEQLNTLFESTVTNSFAGLHYGNLYCLGGAGDWLQISFENVRTHVAAPEVMLWVDGSETNLTVRDSRDVTIGTCTVVDPVVDSDSDGISNADEVLAGSDPLNEQSRFELRQTDRYILSWEAAEGRVYTIEWAPSLSAPFQTLENSIVWPQNSWTDTVHSVESAGFYRISVRRAE